MKNNTVEEKIKNYKDITGMKGTNHEVLLDHIITTLSQHHQDEMREVYREILNKKRDNSCLECDAPPDLVSVDDIEALAQSRGIDISDKKTENASHK